MKPTSGQGSDRQLAARCREGDPRAFDEAYDAHASRLYGTALRMLGRTDEAEDVVQETFMKLFRKAPPRISNLGGWLHRVATNACLDRLRARKRHGETDVAPESSDATPPRRHGSSIDLQRAVDRLPEGAREVFLLYDVEGFKHREVAELLEISEGTSKSQLFRARELLRAELLGGETP